MRFEEFEVHGVSGGETFRLIAVHETFDNEVSALDVDLHVMSQNHDGPHAALDIRRLTGDGDILGTDGNGLSVLFDEVHFANAVRNGAELKRGSAVAGVEDLGDHYVVHTASGNYESRYLVNCAGVHGHEISAMVGESEWMPKHSRGEYYLLDKSSGDLVNHVIFQCPSVLGKGVLVAPTVHGNLIVGPNAEPVEDGDDRATTQSGLDQVAAFGRKSVPSIDLRQSIRNFSGVRAVTSEEDFIIRPAKNSPRMLYVCGIKSPGLSAAPAIADYALEKLKEMGLAAEKKTMWSGKRTQIRFRKLSDSEKAELVRKDPRYGRIICRCETITEGEIIAAIHSPIPPCSIDGVKRRTGAGMGRCQGGFCGPRVLKILADELGKDPMEIVQDGSATWLLMEETKGGSGK